jgi:hypothetical protein
MEDVFDPKEKRLRRDTVKEVKSNRSAVFSNFLFAVSQGFMFFVIALVFWFSSCLVSEQDYTSSSDSWHVSYCFDLVRTKFFV